MEIADDHENAIESRPVITSIKRRVKPECEAEYEQFLRDARERVKNFSGYLGADVLRPASGAATDGDGKEWEIILRFDGRHNLQKWLDSSELRRLLARADELTVGASKVERVNGLEAWFTLPARDGAPVPAKWKTAILSGAVIYILLQIVPPLLAPLAQQLPPSLETLVGVSIITPLMTWVLMPLVTRLFKSWLYPPTDRIDD